MNDDTGQVRYMPQLIHHAASCGSGAIPNSAAAVRDCLEAGAQAIEIDIIPLADGDFVLLHDPRLENATNGHGNVAEADREMVQRLFYKQNGQLTNTPVGTLSQVIELLPVPNPLERLQLDLKPYAPLTPSVLSSLVKMVSPVKQQVQISSTADWAVRILRRLDGEINLGFDPLLYLDMETEQERPAGVPPFRVGAYGYRDDHPLSAERWGTNADYFAARAEALLLQAPTGAMWYLRAALLRDVLQTGFDWIDFLHQNGSRVAAWTLDAGQSDHETLAVWLAETGIDAITTNTPDRLERVLRSSPYQGGSNTVT
jgi:glycerophosphoryl diester phosphodiesterase